MLQFPRMRVRSASRRALTGRPHPPASARTSEAPGAPASASGAPSTPGWWPWAERSASPPGCRAPAEHGPDRRPGLDVPALAARAPAADPGRSLPGDRSRSGSCAAASPAASSASSRTAPATATERREPSFRIVQSFPPACRTDPRLISGTAPRTAKPDPPHAASRPNRRPHSITTCRSGARTQRSPRRSRHRPSTESGTPSTPGAARLMTAESAQASEGRSCVESSILGRARGRSDRVTAGVGSRSRYPAASTARTATAPATAIERLDAWTRIVHSFPPTCRAEPRPIRGRPPTPADPPAAARRNGRLRRPNRPVRAQTAHRPRQAAQTRMPHTGSRRRQAPDMQSTRRWRPSSPRAATGSAGAPWTPGSAAPRPHGEPSAPSGGHRSHSSAHAYRWGRWSRKNVGVAQGYM